jgi:hypothetical protein
MKPPSPTSLMIASLAIALWQITSHATPSLLAVRLSGMGLALAVILATSVGVILTTNL